MRTGRRRFVSILHYHFTLSQLFIPTLHYHFTLSHSCLCLCSTITVSGCALGANTYWSMEFHVYTPLPFHTITQLFMSIFHYYFTLSHSCLCLCSTITVSGCALGANTYWSTAFHVYTPLPFHSFMSTLHYHFTLSHSCSCLYSTSISHYHTVVYACVPLSLC